MALTAQEEASQLKLVHPDQQALSQTEAYKESIKGGTNVDVAIGTAVQAQQKATPPAQPTSAQPKEDKGSLLYTSPSGKDVFAEDKKSDVAPPTQQSQLAQQLQLQQQQAQAQIDQTNTKWEQIKKKMDAATATTIQGIQESYKVRIAQMEQYNKAHLGGIEKAGIRAGRQRFATEIQTSIISAEEGAGIQRIAALEGQMHTLIGQAQMAAAERDWGMFNDVMNRTQSLRNEQRGLIMDQHQLAMDQERIMESKVRARMEASVFEQSQLVFRQQQEDRVIETLAPSFLYYDSEGRLEIDESADFETIAEQAGVDPQRLINKVNAEIGRLSKLSFEDQKAQLELMDKQSQMAVREAKEAREASKVERATIKTADGIFSVRYDLQGNEISREKIGELSENEKAPSAAQSLAAGFANRVEQAINIFDRIEGEASEQIKSSFGNVRKRSHLRLSPELKEQFQAERNFINAVLRRESGAAIADSEYESATEQYFPTKGDTEQVLKNKKLNRQQALQNMINDAGNAYTPTKLLSYPDKFSSYESLKESGDVEALYKFNDLHHKFPDDSDQEILDVLKMELGFMSEEQTSVKNNDLTAYFQGFNTITQNPNTPVDYFLDRAEHKGFDFSAEKGTPIPAPVSGKVVKVEKSTSKTGWGNSVIIEDAYGNQWRMAHMDTVNVSVGQNINAGFNLGGVGSTGKSTGNHLHIEAKDKNGNFLPLKVNNV